MKKLPLFGMIIFFLFTFSSLQSVYSLNNSNTVLSFQPNNSSQIILTEESFEDTSSSIYSANFSAEAIEIKGSIEEIAIKVKITNTGKTAFNVTINCNDSDTLVKTFPENSPYDYSFETIENSDSVILDYSFSNTNQSELSIVITLDFLFSIEGCSLEHLKTVDLNINLSGLLIEDQSSLTIFQPLLVFSIILVGSILKRKNKSS
ncbi:MAG: hypothetical protein ACTSYA_12505 [Candidatus Kariarchaeaceae archaeon]